MGAEGCTCRVVQLLGATGLAVGLSAFAVLPGAGAERAAGGGAAAAKRLDYGDAPSGKPADYIGALDAQGRFPSRRADRGPSHPASGRGLRLGPRSTGERDSRQVDRDRRDDGASLKARACKTSTLTVVIDARRLKRSLRRRTVYVNAWFDWNRDGDWADGTDGCAPEWGVQNLKLPVRKLGRNGVGVLPIRLKAGKQVDELWWRTTVSLGQRVTTAAGRAGAGPGKTGAYRFGETEDYLERDFRVLPPAAASSRRARAANYTSHPTDRFKSNEELLAEGYRHVKASESRCPITTMQHGTSATGIVDVDTDRFARKNTDFGRTDVVVDNARELSRRHLTPRETDSYRITARRLNTQDLEIPFRVASTRRHRRANPIEEVLFEMVLRMESRRTNRARREEVVCLILITHEPELPRRSAPQDHTEGGQQPQDDTAPPPGGDTTPPAGGDTTPPPGGGDGGGSTEPTTKCNDKVDNDGDGKVDEADPGCLTGPGATYDSRDHNEGDLSGENECPTPEVGKKYTIKQFESGTLIRHLLHLGGTLRVDKGQSDPDFDAGTLGPVRIVCSNGTEVDITIEWTRSGEPEGGQTPLIQYVLTVQHVSGPGGGTFTFTAAPNTR